VILTGTVWLLARSADCRIRTILTVRGLASGSGCCRIVASGGDPPPSTEPKIMATNSKATAASASDDSNGRDQRILSGVELLAKLRAAKDQAAAKAKEQATSTGGGPKPDRRIAWSEAVLTAAEAMTPALLLPSHAPGKGPSVQGAARGILAAVAPPRDIEALNRPVPGPDSGRNDPLLVLVRGWIWNQLYGCQLYAGPSMADGGSMPVEVVLNTLLLEAEKYKGTAWSQVMFGKGQTSILAQISNQSGRFAILNCEDFTIQLVRDFNS
jgi:hypothetical protein